MLAIAVGGGLGFVVPIHEDAKVAAEPALPEVVQPIAPAKRPPPPAAPRPDVAKPEQPEQAEPAEIEIQPEPVKPGVVRAAPMSPRKPKPTKTARCNVYEHMDGC